MTRQVGTKQEPKSLQEKPTGFSQDTFEENIRRHDEPEWLQELRQEAWRVYLDTPMPSRADEDWRRTDISGLRLEDITPFLSHDQGAKPVLDDLLARSGDWDKSGLLIHGNSEKLHRNLAPGLAEKGVVLTNLSDGVRDYPELVKEYLMEGVLPTYGKFAALNGAFFSSGTLVYVPKGLELDLPLHSFSWVTQGGLGTVHRVLIVLEAGSSLTFVDEYGSLSQSEQGFHCGVVEIFLNEGARLQYISLQDWGRHVYDFTVQRALLGKDSSLKTMSVALGSHLSRTNLDAILQGQGAEAFLRGIYFGNGTQHIDYRTLQEHSAPHTKSDLLFKGALKDGAKAIYEGLVRVKKGAVGTDANQVNRNILLSPQAKADSVPKLEIEASDIARCSHGAALGQVDEEQLFYLMSRGLSYQEARKLIVTGFFEVVLAAIPIGALTDRLRQGIEVKLQDNL